MPRPRPRSSSDSSPPPESAGAVRPGTAHPDAARMDVSWNKASAPDTAPRSTVVALVGADSDELLSGLGGLPALVALSLRESEPAAAARILAATSTPYVVHD